MTKTNDDLNTIADEFFERTLENGVIDLDALTTGEITVLFAKIAAKFATYAGDAIDF